MKVTMLLALVAIFVIAPDTTMAQRSQTNTQTPDEFASQIKQIQYDKAGIESLIIAAAKANRADLLSAVSKEYFARMAALNAAGELSMEARRLYLVSVLSDDSLWEPVFDQVWGQFLVVRTIHYSPGILTLCSGFFRHAYKAEDLLIKEKRVAIVSLLHNSHVR